jgi:hypothetical protein
MWRSLAPAPALHRRQLRLIFGYRRSPEIHIAKLVSMKQLSRPPRGSRYDAFLRRLRAGGRSNMYGAIPYLMARFELDRETAFRVVCEWVDQQEAAPSGEARGTPRTRSA